MSKCDSSPLKRKRNWAECDDPLSANQKPLEERLKHWIPELCRQYYTEGSMVGSAGSITARFGEEIFIAPSGIQKEKIQPDDLFIQTVDGKDIYVPPCSLDNKLKKSACTPLFVLAYKKKNVGAVIHTHSKNAARATLLIPGTTFSITHQEMIKGIVKCDSGDYYRYNEKVVIPIIENSLVEEDLCDAMTRAMDDFPEASAILVRRHGIFVWGKTLEKTKLMYECFDYLLDMAIMMIQNGLDPAEKPQFPDGAYLSPQS